MWHGDRPKARCSAWAVWVPGHRRGFSAPHGSLLQNDAKQCPCQDPLRQRPQGTRQRPKDALGASISSKRHLFCPLRLPPAEAPVPAGRAGPCDPRGDLAPPDRGGREGARALTFSCSHCFHAPPLPARSSAASHRACRWRLQAMAGREPSPGKTTSGKTTSGKTTGTRRALAGAGNVRCRTAHKR